MPRYYVIGGHLQYYFQRPQARRAISGAIDVNAGEQLWPQLRQETITNPMRLVAESCSYQHVGSERPVLSDVGRASQEGGLFSIRIVKQ